MKTTRHAGLQPATMTVYRGCKPEGVIEDHGTHDVRAWVGLGEERKPLGSFPDRKTAMKAVSEAAKAAGEARR